MLEPRPLRLDAGNNRLLKDMATTHYGPAGAVVPATGNGSHPPRQSFWALTLGCIGVVTDGSVRDLEPVHALGFQLVYLLKGKARFWYDGFGAVDMVAGSSVYQPPGIRHEMLSCSKSCEILEITMPAEFATRAA